MDGHDTCSGPDKEAPGGGDQDGARGREAPFELAGAGGKGRRGVPEERRERHLPGEEARDVDHDLLRLVA